MKAKVNVSRIPRNTLLALFVLCLLGSGKSFPQSSQQTTSLEWQKLRTGGEVLKLWEFKKDLQWPQIAVLRLSEEEYKHFEADPKKYLQENEVFGTGIKLNRIVSRVDLTEDKPGYKKAQSKTPPKTNDPWIVVVDHNAYCDSAIIADSVLSPQP